jgi:hypothetical protein
MAEVNVYFTPVLVHFQFGVHSLHKCSGLLP